MRKSRPKTTFFAALALCTALTARTPSAGATEIAVIAPQTGPFESLGVQVADGARRGLGTDGVDVYDDACTMEGGKAAAEKALAAGLRIAVGFLCTESFQGAAPVLSGKGISVLSVGIRAESMRKIAERHKITLLRLAPASTAEAEAVGRLLPPVWREANFAIIDDGAIGARDLAEAFRNAAETAGLEPVFNDTFRPQLENQIALVQRLAKAGATHVFAGGDRADIAVMARDAAEKAVPLTIAGGEALDAADDQASLADGVIMIGLADWSRHSPETEAIAEEMRARGEEPSRYFWRAIAAGQIAAALARAAHEQISGPDGPFPTMLGPVRFDAQGSWTAEPYGLYVQKDGRFEAFGAEAVR
jgi:branched-chain amino acid transport system substrate-binding protein